MEEPTVSMLALRGFALVSTEELGGELITTIETTEVVSGCPECGTVARPKDRRTVTLRDLPAGGRSVRLPWRKRIWSCPDPDGPKRTWTERSWLAAPRSLLK